MSPSTSVDDTVNFLYHCIANTDGKIDYDKVGAATGIKPNAARMRLTRLKAKMEAGSADGKVTVKDTGSPVKPGADGNTKGARDDDDDDDGDETVTDPDVEAELAAAELSPPKKRKTAKEVTPKKVRTMKATPRSKAKAKFKAEETQDEQEGEEGGDARRVFKADEMEQHS
ncbi:hypothetical protein BDW74DRAFT_174497 [Aspergillus multicolor]|uniref:uncharacterized protein n=1 Tax=Aspergillus multicolor TaxID=41759 RepID=UPI003CCDE455